MFGIIVKITKFTDDWQPGWIKCEFTDALDNLHIFNEKVPIVTAQYLDKNSIYPQDGIIACEIIERNNINDREIVKVNTESLWHIESKDGETVFEVLAEQLTEFEYNPVSIDHLFIPFQNNMISINYHLQNIYDAFNKRDVETILAMMADDVKWANGWEGGFVYGRDAVREYWRRQFEVIKPQLEILDTAIDDNQARVKIRLIAEDLNGNVLDDRIVEHNFTFENGLIKTFEIGGAE